LRIQSSDERKILKGSEGSSKKKRNGVHWICLSIF
jgi:hypothetical protein